MRRTQIFISYRRDDSAGYARAVYDELAQRYGADRIFIDVDDIYAGQPFSEVIEKALAASAVLLVLIGRRWQGERETGASRINEDTDLVRREVAAGIAKRMRVIPVLIDGAAMPTEAQLPEVLRPLTGRNALELNNTRFADDMKRLTSVLDQAVGARASRSRSGVMRWWGVAAALLLAVVVGAAMWFARTPSASDLFGEWQAEVPYDWENGQHVERFVLSGDASAVHGTASYLGVPRGVLEARIEPDGLTFVTRTQEMSGTKASEATHRYRARRVGDELHFVMQTEGGSSPHQPVSFVARRTAMKQGSGSR